MSTKDKKDRSSEDESSSQEEVGEVPDTLRKDDEVKQVKNPESGKIISLIPAFVSWVFWSVWALLTCALLLYFALVAAAVYSTEVKQELVFLNRLKTPFFANLSDPKGFGLTKAQNFYLNGNAGKIGAWLVPPSSKQTKSIYMLYLHGNGGTRASSHRVELVKNLSKLGYNVLTIDYRGYGDSEGWPTEEGLVEDSKTAYKWLLEKAHGNPLYIVGHSLGASVSLQLAAALNFQRNQLNGVVLLAPFNNLVDFVQKTLIFSPISTVYPNMVDYLDDLKGSFQNDHWIKKVKTPILIFHDHSDLLVPIALCQKLYASGKEVGSTNVRLVDLRDNLGHDYLFRSKTFKSALLDFIVHTT